LRLKILVACISCAVLSEAKDRQQGEAARQGSKTGSKIGCKGSKGRQQRQAAKAGSKDRQESQAGKSGSLACSKAGRIGRQQIHAARQAAR
jgi:hypothetical protein